MSEIFRGSTPSFIFRVPADIDLNTISAIRICFEGLNIKKIWELDELIVDPENHTITLHLDQEMINQFRPGDCVISARLKDLDGEVIPSRPINLNIYNLPDTEVM